MEQAISQLRSDMMVWMKEKKPSSSQQLDLYFHEGVGHRGGTGHRKVVEQMIEQILSSVHTEKRV